MQHSPNLLSQPGSYGSVVFRFKSFDAMNLHAAVLLTIHGEPIAFSVGARPVRHDLTVPSGSRPGSLEGMWLRPDSGMNGVLVIGNRSEKKISGTLSLFDAAGKQWSEALEFGPRQTRRMATSDLLRKSGLGGSHGGFSFQVSSSTSAMDAVHFSYDESSKFSALMEIFSRDPNATLSARAGPDARLWTMRAPMLALRNPDPALAMPQGTVLQPAILVRNTTAKNVVADIALNWRGDSGQGQVKLPEVQLAPFATHELQIGAQQKQLGIPDDARWALVTLTTTALPDDLIAIASSRDQSGRYGLETSFAGDSGSFFAGGELQADDNHNAIAAITNTGTKATNALLTLHYDHGKKKYELQQTIAPGDQMWVNLAQLIRNRVADRKGNTLPVDVNSVTYDLRDLTPGGHSLTASALAVDSSSGSLVNPNHLSCCGDDDASWDPGSFDLVIDGTDFGSIQGVNQCTGAPADITGDFTKWSSANPAIAQVTKGQVKGISPGFTTGSASGLVTEGNGSYCTVVPVQESAPITVEGVPSSEITEFEGTILITQGQFLMTLEPDTFSYDNHSVKESSPVAGTNSCWWNGSKIAQYPTVQGSTWIVDQGGNAGHNQYGLDTVGFESGVVNLIQTQGPQNGVEFPCYVNIHQSMNYDGIDLYVTNLLSQTIGSNTVKVCRNNDVCSGTIPY